MLSPETECEKTCVTLLVSYARVESSQLGRVGFEKCTLHFTSLCFPAPVHMQSRCCCALTPSHVEETELRAAPIPGWRIHLQIHLSRRSPSGPEGMSPPATGTFQKADLWEKEGPRLSSKVDGHTVFPVCCLCLQAPSCCSPVTT